MSNQSLELVWPAVQYLSSYIHALEQGWSPDNRRQQVAAEHLERIAEDSTRFLSEQVDREAKGPAVILPNACAVPRLPGFTQWIWDGEFCGVISLRWQPGTTDLPPYCLGHIGYSVVPWKRQRGYATRALRLMLPQARDEGLAFVELVADSDNIASQRVIEGNGGKLIEQFRKSEDEGGTDSLRFRIHLEWL